MDFLIFTDFAASGIFRDHLGHSFPKYDKEVTLIRIGKVGRGTFNADSEALARPAESESQT